MVYTLRFFFSSKCSLFHNSNIFDSCIIHTLYTGCAKIKKKQFRRLKVKTYTTPWSKLRPHLGRFSTHRIQSPYKGISVQEVWSPPTNQNIIQATYTLQFGTNTTQPRLPAATRNNEAGPHLTNFSLLSRLSFLTVPQRQRPCGCLQKHATLPIPSQCFSQSLNNSLCSFSCLLLPREW